MALHKFYHKNITILKDKHLSYSSLKQIPPFFKPFQVAVYEVCVWGCDLVNFSWNVLKSIYTVSFFKRTSNTKCLLVLAL